MSETPCTVRRMLIVEDEPDLGACLADYFGGRGFAVDTAYSGEEALERVAAKPPDVLLLDILLPGLTGLEVLKRVKQAHPCVRIIMVTALDEAELRAEARFYGAVGYVTKPFDFAESTWAPILVS